MISLFQGSYALLKNDCNIGVKLYAAVSFSTVVHEDRRNFSHFTFNINSSCISVFYLRLAQKCNRFLVHSSHFV